MFGALSQLAESQGFSQKPPTICAGQPIPTIVSVDYPPKVEDPLRELVLYSNDKNADPEKLKFLALSAANLVTDASNIPSSPSNLVPKNMKTLAGIFSGTGAFIKTMEENISKKYSALEPSDSDGFGGATNLRKNIVILSLCCFRSTNIGENITHTKSKIS